MILIKYTDNLRLGKPIGDEKYEEQVQNTNMDILDAEIHSLKEKVTNIPPSSTIVNHVENKKNPHDVTKEQVGLGEVQNIRQMNYVAGTVTNGGVPVFNGNGYSLKDSGFTIGKSVPSDAKFTDTVYTHPSHTSGTYTKVTVNSQGHVVSGSNPTTLSDYGIIDAATLEQGNKADNAVQKIKLGDIEYSGNIVELPMYPDVEEYELTKEKVTDALGYTPYTPNEIDNKFASIETNIVWKKSVETFDDISTRYPTPEDGWTVNVKDTDYTYRYDGSNWIIISANAIPKATNEIDGLLSKEDHTNYDDANSKKHEHRNKSILDSITSTIVSTWNNAVSHISDTIKHITNEERINWDSAYSHSTSTHAPFTAEENQNTFSSVKIGDITIDASSKTDTLELVAGTNTTIIPNEENNKITISSVASGDTEPITYELSKSDSTIVLTGSDGSETSVGIESSKYLHNIEFLNIPSDANYGGYIDFHYNGRTDDYTSRIIESEEGTLKINDVLINSNTITGFLNGTANATNKFNVNTISDNTNIDSLITPAFYRCGSITSVKTLINCPTQTAFFMSVGMISTNSRYQEITDINYKKYIRISTALDGILTWGEWHRVYSTADEMTHTYVTKDINVVTNKIGEVKNASSFLSSTSPNADYFFVFYDKINNRYITDASLNLGTYISYDGKTWEKTAKNIGLYATYGMIYVEELELYLAIGVGAGSFAIAYSTDGNTWTRATFTGEASIASSTSIYGIAYGNNKLIAVGLSGKIFISEDGKSWGLVDTDVTTNNLNSICYANNKFIAVGDKGTIIYSTDNGSTWTKASDVSSTYYLNSIAYGNNKFVVVGKNSTGSIEVIYYSTSGTSWTIANSFSYDNTIYTLRHVSFVNSMFVIVGNEHIYFSSDGVSDWRDINVGNSYKSSYNCSAYNNGRLVFVAQNMIQYADFEIETKNVEEIIGSLSNVNAKLSYMKVTLTNSKWTTSTEYSGYGYVYEVPITDYYDPYPEWYLKPLSSSNLIPTTTEQTTFDSIAAMKLDTTNMKLKFYTATKPTTTILVIVKGVSG